MKQILFFLIGFVFLSCNQNGKDDSKSISNASEIETKTENFDWLLGSWKRLKEEKGKETFENWEKINSNEYLGVGFTLQNGDTISQEKMQLIKANEKWNLKVKIPGEAESTIFKMTQFNEKEFVCENNEIEFPNKIKYWKNGNMIYASVSNAEMNIPFEFEKIAQ